MYFTRICVLFIFVVTTGNFTQAMHNGWMEHDSPTCEQLKSLWDIISRTVRLSQITNEIPIIPVEIFTAIDQHQRYGANRRGPGHSMEGISHRKNIQDVFLEDALQPSSLPDHWEAMQQLIPLDSNLIHSPLSAKNQEINGVFGNFLPQESKHWQEEANILSSAPKKISDESEMFMPQWGSPEEVGSFGRFLDVDEGMPQAAMIRTPKGPIQEWSVATQPKVVPHDSIQIPCTDTINKKCKGSEQCICDGLSVLQCVHGRCSSNNLINGNLNEYGIWHNEPLPRSHLGLVRRLRKRSNRSIFM